MSGRGPRVLLTGASGFIGSQTIAPLLERGYDVHALGRRPGSRSDVSWHAVDLLDQQATAAVVAEVAASEMLHLAWYTEHGRFWGSPENLSWLGASLSLLRAFAEAGGRRAVMAGTCAEYDWGTPVERCRELGPGATPEHPRTLYGSAKHATRMVAEVFARDVGLSLSWGRVFFLYGPGEDERRLVPELARALLAARAAETSDGTQIRDFMHVEDVARAFVALVASGVEGPVNVASGEAVQIRRVIELVAEATGHGELLRIGALPRREDEPERLVADVGRLREEVGFRPAISLAQGIAATVAGWRELSERD